ncbi:MFS transporter [Streptomyces sp. NPDC090499]|uniref:MFS transporter n=1 Tax=unclassified Streptomyces TaxID=2593676 RepID=UPI003813F71B
MIVLDGSIVNVALPSIQRSLDFSQAGLAWVINAYMIAFGGLLLLAGRLGDLLGRRRLFLVGQVVFTVASALCGVSRNPGTLLAARFLQGVGGAAASAVVLGMVVTMTSGAAERTKAISVYAFASSAGGSLGVVLGGIITQALSWHWIFFVNVPIGIVVTALARRLVEPDGARRRNEGADVPGAVLVTAALMLGVYAIVKAADYGWASARTLGLGAASVVLLAAFFVREAKAASPLLPLRILRAQNVAGANLVMVLMLTGMYGFQFLCALYIQRVLGFNAVFTGLGIWPVALSIGAFSLFVSSRLIQRFGARTVLLAGLLIIASGLAILSQAPADGRYATDVLPALPLVGIGFGLGMPALTTLAMSSATPADSGVTSGLINTTQQIGGSLGLAVLASLAASRSDALLAVGRNTAEALAGGYDRAFGVAAAIVAAGFVPALVALRSPTAGPGGEPKKPAAEKPREGSLNS